MSSDSPDSDDVAESVHVVRIEDEMEQSYIDYAMSVIVGRALPDARDGLKPVQRRILYAMHDMGLGSSTGHRKASSIVGETMGNYHPHGDSAIYDALARMAQGFSLRYPLIDGQGNFGSIDGDPPAAMRYTEARLAPIAEEILADIDKDTVDFQSNYDDRLEEPVVLPAGVPNLLINGTSGIAVGMSTNIPPHNLSEVIDACIQVINNPTCTVADLIHTPENPGPIKGPDFPTGANIMGRDGIYDAYTTGRGHLRVRAELSIEAEDQIVITELPYQENKARRIERIANDVKEEKIEGIRDIRDESDRDGIRIVIELKRGTNPEVVKNQLLEHHLETTFAVMNLALVDEQPRKLTLKDLVEEFVFHRQEVVRRRSQFELEEAEEQAHLLKGRLKALDLIDDVVDLIQDSKDRGEAIEGLQESFDFTEAQAEHIVRMQLGSLTSLEAENVQTEYDDVQADIERLNEILANEDVLLDVIKDELRTIQSEYSDERRTRIREDTRTVAREELIQEEQVVVVITQNDYVKRMPVSYFDPQHRGGKGIIGIRPKEGDTVSRAFLASTHDDLLCFTNRGQVHQLKVYELPEMGRTARGTHAVNVLNVEQNEEISAVVNAGDLANESYLSMVTRQGYLKRTAVEAFQNIHSGGIRAIRLNDSDRLIDVELTTGDQDLLIGTRDGMTIRFAESEARPMGRTAQGVRGIALQDTDTVAGLTASQPDDDRNLLVVTNQGYGKQTPLSDYRKQSRYGKGLIGIKTSNRTGRVVSLHTVHSSDEMVLLSKQGQIMRTFIHEISVQGRNTMGVRVMRLDGNDEVIAVDVFEPSPEARE